MIPAPRVGQRRTQSSLVIGSVPIHRFASMLSEIKEQSTEQIEQQREIKNRCAIVIVNITDVEESLMSESCPANFLPDSC